VVGVAVGAMVRSWSITECCLVSSSRHEGHQWYEGNRRYKGKDT
jgi:hypothetical protein